MITVRDILKEKSTEEIWSVGPQTTVLDALQTMTAKNVGALLVLEDDGRLVGIISERDFVHHVAKARQCDIHVTVAEIMTSKVIVVTPDHSTEQCMAIMTNRRIRHLPVMEDDRLVGLVSIGDLVRGTISEQLDTINNLEKYILGTGYAR